MNFFKLLIVLILAGIISSCGSSSGVPSDKNITSPDDLSTTYLELADYLKRVSGLVVKRIGSTYSVQVRGISSIGGSNEPLYVIDRTRVGSYEAAAALIDPNDIGRVEVLKDVGSTSSYGMLGANGVILIYSKK